MYSASETRFMRYSEYSEYSLFFFHCAMIDASRYRISLKTFYLSALEASCIAVRKLEIPSLNPPTIVQKAKWSLYLPKYISVCKQNNISAFNLNESFILLHSSTPTLPEKTWSHTDNIKLMFDYSEAGEGTAMEICVSMRLISLQQC